MSRHVWCRSCEWMGLETQAVIDDDWRCPHRDCRNPLYFIELRVVDIEFSCVCSGCNYYGVRYLTYWDAISPMSVLHWCVECLKPDLGIFNNECRFFILTSFENDGE